MIILETVANGKTNGFWCRGDDTPWERLSAKGAGLDDILISANLFILKGNSFDLTERAVRS